MKKLLVLVALFTTVYTTSANAQEKTAADKVSAIQEKLKPQLMQKANLTDAEASRVLKVHFTYEGRLRQYEGLSAEEKQKNTAAIAAAEQKEFAAIPLNEEKIKAVNEFFTELKNKADKRKASGTN